MRVFRETEGCVWPLNTGGNNKGVMHFNTCVYARRRGRRLGCVGESNSLGSHTPRALAEQHSSSAAWGFVPPSAQSTWFLSLRGSTILKTSPGVVSPDEGNLCMGLGNPLFSWGALMKGNGCFSEQGSLMLFYSFKPQEEALGLWMGLSF